MLVFYLSLSSFLAGLPRKQFFLMYCIGPLGSVQLPALISNWMALNSHKCHESPLLEGELLPTFICLIFSLPLRIYTLKAKKGFKLNKARQTVIDIRLSVSIPETTTETYTANEG